MSNAVFPVLPGLSWGRTLTPVWKTDVKESVSGMEFRWSAMAYPRYRVALKYEVLRAGAGIEELQALVGFFNARRGAWDDFLWLDDADHLAADELLGLGDGANKVYPIFRRRGGFAEPVLNQIKAITEDGLYSVRFERDSGTEDLIVKIVDSETDEVIRQIPPEELINLSKHLKELSGNLVNTVS